MSTTETIALLALLANVVLVTYTITKGGFATPLGNPMVPFDAHFNR